LHTGARVSELLALRWDHLDLETGKMRIEGSLSWVHGEERGYGKTKPLFGPPQTDSSYRTLDLAPDLVHELKAWTIRSRYSREEDLVFSNSLGKPLHRAFLYKGLQLAIKKASRAGTPLPHVSVHGLRHSFASLMIQLGKPVSQVSQILGHKNPDLTLKVYTHWFSGASSASAMADLAAAIRRPNTNPVSTGSKTVADAATGELAATK
jgi:integrase